jgi:hypothetical protein
MLFLLICIIPLAIPLLFHLFFPVRRFILADLLVLLLSDHICSLLQSGLIFINLDVFHIALSAIGKLQGDSTLTLDVIRFAIVEGSLHLLLVRDLSVMRL